MALVILKYKDYMQSSITLLEKPLALVKSRIPG